MSSGLTLIGAAFPRTGTMSVKHALETLGLGKCYHMHEVFLNPHHIPIWDAICDGKSPDWPSLFAGYSATLDAPACHYWKDLARTFPEAKVLLLQRDPKAWYESVYETIYQVVRGPDGETDPALRMIRRLFFDRHMEGRFEYRDFAIGVYRRYCRDVSEGVPGDRLLSYEVSQGWEPLCRFLAYDVPPEPFPNRNTRDEFRARTHAS